ncbi:hypothetical protein ACLB2K_062182 [Fragaria x ananassa]
MGNCLMRSSSRVSAQDHEKHDEPAEKEAEVIQQTVAPMSSEKKKKTVRFNLQEDEDDGGRGIHCKFNLKTINVRCFGRQGIGLKQG